MANAEVRFQFLQAVEEAASWPDDPHADLIASDSKPDATQEWVVVRVRHVEGLNQLFRCELTLAHHEDLDAMPGADADGHTIFDDLHNDKTAAQNELNSLKNNEHALNKDPLSSQFWSPQEAQKRQNLWNQGTSDAGSAISGAEKRFNQALGDVTSFDKMKHDVFGFSGVKLPDFHVDGQPIDPAAFVGKLCSVNISRTIGGANAGRWITGVVSEFEDLGNAYVGYRFINVVLVPNLYKLSLRQDSRIYEGKRAMEIVEDVLKRAALYGDARLSSPDVDGDRSTWTEPREYCVQYNETDLEFCQRLLAEEGINYYFEHRKGIERLVLVRDPRQAWWKYAGGDDDSITIAAHDQVMTYDNGEQAWHVTLRKKLRSEVVRLRDYNFSEPAAPAVRRESIKPGEPSGDDVPSVYEYPGDYRFDFKPDALGGTYDQNPTFLDLSKQRLDAYVMGGSSGGGYSNATSLAVGQGVRLVPTDATLQAPFSDKSKVNDLVLVTAATIIAYPLLDGPGAAILGALPGFVGQDYLAAKTSDFSHDSGVPTGFFNQFDCLDFNSPIRPSFDRSKRRRIDGLQTAIVVDDKPDEDIETKKDQIYADALGRIKVRFHWDRRKTEELPAGGSRSCWVRVAQAWAGTGWGCVFMPRVGMEVVVSFLEGDPDKPVVIGCVSNGWHHAPFPQPPTTKEDTAPPDKDRYATLIRTQSHLVTGDHKEDVKHFNELRFEDIAEHERVFVHAERDLNEIVLRDHTATVGRDQFNNVKQNQSEIIGRNQTLKVHGKRTKEILGSEDTLIEKNRTEVVKSKEEIKIHGNRHETVIKKETVTIGKTPADTWKRQLDVSGSRETTITGNDTLNVLMDKTEEIHGSLHVAAKSVKMMSGGDDGTKKKTGIVADEAGNVSLLAEDAPLGMQILANGPENADYNGVPEIMFASQEKGLTVDAKTGIFLECGDTKVEITPDGLKLDAPNSIWVKAGGAGGGARLQIDPKVIAMSIDLKPAGEEGGFDLHMHVTSSGEGDAVEAEIQVAKDDLTSNEAGALDDDTKKAMEDVGLKADGNASEAAGTTQSDADKDAMPGITFSGSNFSVAGGQMLKVEGTKGINVQRGNVSSRILSHHEDDLLKDAQTAKSTWDDKKADAKTAAENLQKAKVDRQKCAETVKASNQEAAAERPIYQKILADKVHADSEKTEIDRIVEKKQKDLKDLEDSGDKGEEYQGNWSMKKEELDEAKADQQRYKDLQDTANKNLDDEKDKLGKLEKKAWDDLQAYFKADQAVQDAIQAQRDAEQAAKDALEAAKKKARDAELARAPRTNG